MIFQVCYLLYKHHFKFLFDKIFKSNDDLKESSNIYQDINSSSSSTSSSSSNSSSRSNSSSSSTSSKNVDENGGFNRDVFSSKKQS